MKSKFDFTCDIDVTSETHFHPNSVVNLCQIGEDGVMRIVYNNRRTVSLNCDVEFRPGQKPVVYVDLGSNKCRLDVYAHRLYFTPIENINRCNTYIDELCINRQFGTQAYKLSNGSYVSAAKVVLSNKKYLINKGFAGQSFEVIYPQLVGLRVNPINYRIDE